MIGIAGFTRCETGRASRLPASERVCVKLGKAQVRGELAIGVNICSARDSVRGGKAQALSDDDNHAYPRLGAWGRCGNVGDASEGEEGKRIEVVGMESLGKLREGRENRKVREL